jgi:CubicO group peptidase (beta-lactamase class C family)
MEIEIDPEKAGFAPGRLDRIDRHLARYVDDGRLTGWQVAVSRDGKLVHHGTYGLRDREAGLPVEPDTIWRIYSMTKPLTSVAAMMLYEDGLLPLRQPIGEILPEFADARVYTGGSALNPGTVPATEPIRVWHLLSHTSGLTYGFQHQHPADELHRLMDTEFFPPAGTTLADTVRQWARIPLLFQPGSAWNYGVSTDVLGRVVEVVSGLPLDRFLAERIIDPLGMVDTAFRVPAEKADRLAALYLTPKPGREPVRRDDFTPDPRGEVTFLAGGGGLVSTAADYLRFTRMLLNKGELDGVRLLGSRTVDFMTRNHLPGNADIATLAPSTGPTDTFEGIGFGLGFSVVIDPVRNEILTSPGEYAWGGLASTAFWVDPVERITVVFMTQLVPSGTYPIRSELRALVNSALMD